MKKLAKKKTSSSESALQEIIPFDLSEKEKRPEEIKVGDLFLDPANPRLADEVYTGTQASILKVLEKGFNLQPLIDSMYRNGYFWEEPLVAVREPLSELKNRKVLVVVEGNRRLAALKTIHGEPQKYPSAEARARLETVPVIVRDERSETLAFVGFRHITGIVPWEAAAKAQYAHDLVKRGLSLQQIAETIGDKTSDIGRWVRTQSLMDIAHEQGLNEADAAKAFYFSYLLTSTDAPATKKWLELKIDNKSGVVKELNGKRFEDLWYWLYGSKSQERSAVVPESRQIHRLNKVIASPVAVSELQRTGNLERALVLTLDHDDYVIETLGKVRSLLQDLTGNLVGEEQFSKAYKHKISLQLARSEFTKISNALTDLKERLGF